MCGVCEWWFLGERMAVVSGWLVPLENSLLPSPVREQHPRFRAEIEGENL